MEKLLLRINELARLSKQRELNEVEKKEREDLRKQYINLFKMGLEQKLQNIKIIDKNGDIATLKKKT